ncbi:outer membrane beta-barrel family protein [Mucilaginibacter gynuensis]|uniref:Outer membrane beta-barrel family protein n=1 Tax=Mucilaginibacter gynuensis TaxID=1302236 RepID=A0ABP8FPP6_9SPHI
MKLKIAALIAAWITIASTLAFAQDTLKLSGKVTDANGHSLDGVTVYLLNGKDSTLIKTTFTDTTGIYIFINLKKANYRLSASMVGYQNYRSASFELSANRVLESVSLRINSNTLQQVSINATRPFVQQKIDRTLVNPEAMISNAGGTALDVLEKAPGVIVDQNGAISLKSKGVTIFIDDKPTYLSGADLENYLRSLSAAAIDQLELMPNPPAKYDAAGSGGVINIKTKKNKVRGFNGGINLAYTQGKYARTNNSLNFNYRNNKLNVTGNLGYNHANTFNDLDINRHFEDGNGVVTTNFLQNSFLRNTGNNYTVRLGVDYYLSDKSTLGINVNGIYNPHRTTSPVTSNFSDAQNRPDSTIIAQNTERDVFKNGGINLNYRHKYDQTGREFTADIDYLNYYTKTDQLFANSTYLPGGTATNIDQLTGMLPAHINIYTAKADYDHPLSNGIKLSAGLKTAYTHTDNVADYFLTKNEITQPDYDKTNHFIYRENINAAYLNATKDYKRLSFQAGLRLENTISDGHQLGNVQKPDSTFKRNYTNLFPTLYIQYKLDTGNINQLRLNYGRRINRPYYQDLNPFLSPLDRFTYYTGNPFLKPSFTDNIELIHSYKEKFNTTLSYSKTRDDVNETIEIVDGIYYSRPGNIGKYTVITLSFDATFDPAKWLNIFFYSRVSNIHSVSDFYTGLLDTRGTYFFARTALTFKLKKDWQLQAEGGYQSKITSGQFVIGSRGRVNTGVSKKLSAATTVKFTVNDIFYTFKNTGVINNLNRTSANWQNLSDTRNFVLSLSYRFGKAISGQRQHDANGAESEQSRVKN